MKIKYTNPDEYNHYMKRFFMKESITDFSEIDLAHFGMGVVEFGENKDRPHYHILVAFRALSTNISTLKYQINKYCGFRVEACKDIEIKLLSKEQDIYNAFNYLTKELNDDEDSLFHIAQYSYLSDKELDDTGNNYTGFIQFKKG